MLAAAEQILAADGVDRLTVTAVTTAAGVSRTTFYANFADREDCLLALFDEVTERLRVRMASAYTAQRDWLDGVRASLCTLLDVLDDQPHVARFLIVGGVCGESPLVVRRRRLLAELARALEFHGPAPATRHGGAPFGAEALVSGAASIVHSRLLDDPPPRLRDLSGSLMAVLVLPFVGEGVARGELARPVHSAGRAAPQAGGRARPPVVPPRRVTPRTATVLSVIAEGPGISNRSLARRAGSIDEGQASRLLTRLAGLGLIANRASARERGASNAWQITQAGSDLLAALAAERPR